MVSNSTNTTYSGSAALKAMQQWYTMEDVTNTVRPYKVFTALLTQSGDSAPMERNPGDDLFKGVTYEIFQNDGYNFIPFGATDNNVGTFFVCNQDVLTENEPYFDLKFNQGAPVATVLENTIGNVWFVYETPGIYSCESINLFTQNKTYSTPYDFFEKELLYNNCVRTKWVDATKINILTTGIGLNDHNNGLESTAFEIRVYN
jgi:hypothetical protein